MAIKNKQARAAVVGKIRIGELALAKSGNTYPRARQTFRLTSRNKAMLEAAQAVFGGELRPWKDKPGQFELLTEVNQLKAMFSPKAINEDGDVQSLSTAYELWWGGTCLRRCDGETCEVWENNVRVKKHCQCPLDDRDAMKAGRVGSKNSPPTCCSQKGRMNVILTELPAIGMWRFETGSEIGLSEYQGFLDQLAMIGAGDAVVPITMTIDWREKGTAEGQATEKFAVVVITIDPSPIPAGAMLEAARRAAIGPGEPRSLSELPVAQAPALPAASEPVVDAEPVEDFSLQQPDEKTAKVQEAIAYLEECGFTEREVTDFKTWCGGEKLPWVTRALGFKLDEVTEKARFFEL